ncbi:MAG: alpha/beta fold hydrolase [Kordiimonas sp.]
MELFYRTMGEGEPLLLLHGLFGSADNLGGIARLLAEEYRVIAVDHRNHGRSPHHNQMNYQAMAADIYSVMDKEGISEANIFGHSMGGKVAMQMALDEPHRVTKLVVGDIAPVTYERHHDAILAGMQAVEKAAPEGRKAAEVILSGYEREPAVLSFLLTNWRRDETGKWGWRLNVDVIDRDYMNIVAGNKGAPYKGNVLFLRGGNSDYVLADHRDIIIELFPNATVRTIEGTGHWLHAEKPDMVARAIIRFLKK